MLKRRYALGSLKQMNDTTKTACPDPPIMAYRQPCNLHNVLVRAELTLSTNEQEAKNATERGVKHAQY